jgi:geranylgeranyl pyrophosphate synthase
MRDEAKVLENMPAKLGYFYAKTIPLVRTGIASYFRDSIDREYFETLTGEPVLFDQDYEAIYDSIILPTQQYLAASGKVLRPILSALILEAYGSETADSTPFLAAIEVMEDSSIIMDDYIDNSELRRGILCAHVQHGFALANIAGCTGFALAHYVFYKNILGFDDNKARRLLDAVAWEHVQMAFGQIEELYWTESNVNDVSESQYFQQVIARCAFLSFRGPLRYAAIIADAPSSDIPILMRLGEYLLIGYHIKGDDLDMSPDSAAWGKIAGEDITTGRRTLLINHTLSVANAEDRATIERIIDSRTEDEAEKKLVYHLIIKYKAFEHSRKIAETYHAKCYELIDTLQTTEGHKSLLQEFADFAILRRRV